MFKMKFVFPADCVMLMDAAGTRTAEGIEINCIIEAAPGRRLAVNNVPCIPGGNQYTAKVTLKGFKTILSLIDIDTGEREAITVFYLKDAHMTYRFSLDDNIWFFQNIAKNQHIYKSIFEDPYLALLKTMHDRYGTKFHVNIYYQCPEFGGFTLDEFPDKYKSEWIANSHWLLLSFHANANLPDRPYIRGTYEQTKFEHDRIMEQIIRFAGRETFAGPMLTVHWGDATVETVRALRSSGIKGLMGSFRYADPTGVSIKYHLNAEQCAMMNVYGVWYDKAEDVVFFRYGAGMQHGPLDDIAPNFDQFRKTHPLYTFKEMCVHEQYFYPHYVRYMPDYYERFDTAIRWCHEHGYRPAFIKEIIDFDKI